jgi:TolA-binding protein
LNDPGRLRDGGSDAPPELSDLFRDAVKPEPLNQAVDSRLSAQIGVLAALPVSSVVKVMPWLVGGGAVVLAGAMALVVQRRVPAPEGAPSQPTAIAAPAPAVPDPALPETPESQTTPDTKAHAPSSSGRSAPPEASSTPEDALAGEARLLNQAHDVMATDPRKALAIASDHAKRYPHGQLAAERELILVQALVKLGRAREAEARGRALRKSTPNSIYGERLDTILHGK